MIDYTEILIPLIKVVEFIFLLYKQGKRTTKSIILTHKLCEYVPIDTWLIPNAQTNKKIMRLL